MQIASSGAIPLLMRLLASGVSKTQEAALGALAALVKDNSELARLIAQTRCKSIYPIFNIWYLGKHTINTCFGIFYTVEKGERPAPFILRLVRDKSPTMRLAAATWYV